MIPNIPLSPQQRRQRRNNLLYLCSTAGVSLAIIIYYFIPRGEQGVSEESAPPPTAAPTAPVMDAEATAAAAAEAALAPTGAANGLDALPPSAEADNEAADTPLTEEELAKLPAWQAALSRLPKEQRLAFTTSFSRAKEAYGTEQWTTCLAHLDNCELIYNGSPNVWNLRACALLAGNALEEAEQNINRSLALNPQDGVALMCQSELLMLRRDFRACIPLLERLRALHQGENEHSLRDAFTFHQLLCHLMLRQEMEARALAANLTPLTDSPLYYFSEAAFRVYKGDSQSALESLRSATTVYGDAGTSSYRKWMDKCGLAEKYVRAKRN